MRGIKMKENIKRLYEDWTQSKNIKDLKKAHKYLQETTKNPANFKKFIEVLGPDGVRMKKYFDESKNEFGEGSHVAKRNFAKFLLEEEDGSVVSEIGLTHMPVMDRSKSMVSNIQVNTPSGLPAEILRAIVGGNMNLAAQLTAKGWSKLSIADRNLILNLGRLHSGYNVGSGVEKDSGHTNYYEVSVESASDESVEKKSDLPKKDFLKKAFPFTDIENMKL